MSTVFRTYRVDRSGPGTYRGFFRDSRKEGLWRKEEGEGGSDHSFKFIKEKII